MTTRRDLMELERDVIELSARVLDIHDRLSTLTTLQAEHLRLGHADAHESDMTKEEAQTILSTGQPCDWCGRYHAAMVGCNCLSEMTMDASGKPNHVKYRPEGTWKPQGLSADDLARVIARG